MNLLNIKLIISINLCHVTNDTNNSLLYIELWDKYDHYKLLYCKLCYHKILADLQESLICKQVHDDCNILNRDHMNYLTPYACYFVDLTFSRVYILFNND